MRKATKVRLYPTTEEAALLDRQFGAVRFCYNKGLALKKRFYDRTGANLSAKHDLKKLLPIAKKSRKYNWLGQCDSIALQQALINLDKAFQNFFDPKLPAKFPTFKRKHGGQKSYHCVGVSVVENGIKLPKLKSPIRAVIHRPIEGEVKSITLSKTATGKYYASILIEDGVEYVSPADRVSAEKIKGYDLGLTHLLIDSSGSKVDNPRFMKRAAKNLKRKQQALSRKQKGSRCRAKARLLVAKCHEKIANARNDFQHKLSRRMVDENQAIILETLKVKNMIKNRKLAKHIADASWGSLVEKLEYKAKERGRHLVKIDQWFASSKTCSYCGFKVEDLPLDVRHWDCPNCSASHDRDINAGINIRQRGIIELKAAGLVVSADGGLRKSGEIPAAA